MRPSTPLTGCIFISDASINYFRAYSSSLQAQGMGKVIVYFTPSLPNKSDSSKIHRSYKTKNPSSTRGRGLSIPRPSPPSTPGALCWLETFSIEEALWIKCPTCRLCQPKGFHAKHELCLASLAQPLTTSQQEPSRAPCSTFPSTGSSVLLKTCFVELKRQAGDLSDPQDTALG